ncbi:RYamide receptor-like [Oculina patagonica]
MMATSNRTMNGTQASSCSSDPTAEIIAKFFAYCLILVVFLIGNTLIGIIVYKTKAMRKTTNLFIVNMAMSDLLYPVFALPRELLALFVDPWLIGGPLGQALCKLYVFFADVFTTVSIQSLVLIAFDRFGAVVFPLSPALISSKLCLIFIPATWIVAMAVQSPYLVAYRLVEYSPGKLICAREWNAAFRESLTSYRNYILAVFVVLLYTPLAVMSVVYCKIVLKLKSQTIPGEQSVSVGQQRMKRERNVLKMAIAIVLAFAVCWLPFSIIGKLKKFGSVW